MVIIHCFLNNVVINVDIELWSRLPCWRHHITSDWCVFECVRCKRKDMIVEKTLLKFSDQILHGRDGVRRHCLTTFEPGIMVIADRTI